MTDRVLTSAEEEHAYEARRQAHAKALETAAATRRQFGTSALVRVGDGRGFVVCPRDRMPVVITAAHCLPHQPPALAIAGEGERTYVALLAPPQETPSIPALCIFIDAVADIAVLEVSVLDSADGFWNLTLAAKPLLVARTASQQPAQLIGLDGSWFPCNIRGRFLSENPRPIEGGMSGSPILDAKGRAIGVVTSADALHPAGPHGPQALLYDDLPGGLSRRFRWFSPARGAPIAL